MPSLGTYIPYFCRQGLTITFGAGIVPISQKNAIFALRGDTALTQTAQRRTPCACCIKNKTLNNITEELP